LDASDFNKLE